jgi:phage-related protein
MPYDLSVAATLEKNKISSNQPILILLEIIIPNPELTLHIVRNNEDITWRGILWNAYPFNVGSINQDAKGELPNLPVNLAASYDIVKYLEDSQGAKNATVNMYLVHAGHLDDENPMYSFNFGIKGITVGEETINIDLGADIILLARYPVRIYQKERCQCKRYGDIECGATSAIMARFPACNRTMANCDERCNLARFGAFTGIPGGGGVYANAG